MPCLRALGSKGNAERADRTGESDRSLGARVRGALRAIDPLKKVRFKRAIRRGSEGSPLRGLPNTT